MGGNYEKSVYNQLVEVMGRLDSIEKSSKKDFGILNDKIEYLEKENTALTHENQLLKDDNERLKRIINNDSSNSSLPPSSDQKGRASNTYNSREKTGRKAGGQKGHKGTTLTKKEIEEKLSTGKFEHTIKKLGTPNGSYVTKYVLDLKIVPVIHEIRIYADKKGKFHIPQEYRSDVTYGAGIKAMAVDLYSEGVMSNERIGIFLNTISENVLSLSAGSIYGFIKNFAEKSAASLQKIKTELLNEETVCTDATVVTVNRKQAYVRNMSSDKAVVYYAMESKSIKALNKIDFLTSYAGNLEHDHETALYRYGTGHGECNVHLLRYLKKNTDESNNDWSVEMSNFFCDLNRERKERICVAGSFTEVELKVYEDQYDRILEQGRLQNKKTKGCLTKKEEKTLLNRLEKYKINHLLFLHEFSVPFQNNMSERDLRKCKNRQKMAGGFRKHSGNEMYCSIMSIVETCKRKKMRVLENIIKIFEGTPAIF